MLNDLKRQVCKANKDLASSGVVRFTWGNVSGFDSSMGLFVIKPSGVPYEDLQPELMVVMSLEGQKVEGRLKPSVDSDIHRAIYVSWPFSISGIAHTHSTYAVAFAQAGLSIPALGTSHADYFGGPIPITRAVDKSEINENYGRNLGSLIVATAAQPEHVPAVLVDHHGPFTWGKSPSEAVQNAVVLEEIAHAAYLSRMLNPKCEGLGEDQMNFHHQRRLDGYGQ